MNLKRCLSPRQAQVLQILCDSDATFREVAQQLGITQGTARTYALDAATFLRGRHGMEWTDGTALDAARAAAEFARHKGLLGSE